MKAINKDKVAEFFINENINVFIGSSSFEKRCFAVADNLSKVKIDRSLIYRVIDLDRSIVDNSKLFSMKIASNEFMLIDLKISDPLFSFRNIKESLKEIFVNDAKNIALDITTFTHEGLLMIFRMICYLKREEDKVLVYYNGASNYSKNHKKREDKWLTKGVKDVRSIIGYSGYSDPSAANHLMILFGFESERTLRLIDEFEYGIISLAFGSKEASISSKHQEMNEERHQQILELLSNSQMFEISLTDPIKTKNEILKYVSQYEDQNVVIVPMNNKISTIGAGLAAIENKNIQLSYLQPNRYNLEGYSEAGDDFYIWEMPKLI